MQRRFGRYNAVWITSVVALLCAMAPLAARANSTTYPTMAPVDRYLMSGRNAEIALARTAAPDTISDDATVMVLTRTGYRTAVAGSNGFVCLVERSWTSSIDFAEKWNPKLRGPDCYDPAAVRSVLPSLYMMTRLTLAGDSQEQVAEAVKSAYARHEFPPLEQGAMSYMMSKSAYLTDQDGHNFSHLMFFFMATDGQPLGADLPKAPLASASVWFPNDDDNPLNKGFPPLRIFMVGVKHYSDGSVVPTQPIK
jgi:hypothetical protein